MASTVQIDDKQFRRKMEQYVDRLGHEAVDVVQTQARLLFKQVIRFTPPKTKSEGKSAVTRDVARAMFPLETEDARSEGMAEAIQTNDVDAINAIIERSGGWKGWQARHFSPSLHRQARDRRGRVRRSQRIYVPESRELKRYAREKVKNVGMAKGAWSKAYQAVGGKPPKWIEKAGKDHGLVDTHRLRDTVRPAIVATNKAVSNSVTRRPLANAVRVRIKSMGKDIRRRLKETSKRLNLR